MKLTTILRQNRTLTQLDCNRLRYDRDIDLDYLIDITINELNVTKEAFLSELRHRNLVDARRIVSYFARLRTKKSLAEIGSKINRDHSSIVHLSNSCHNLMNVDKNFAKVFESVRQNL